MKQVLRFCEIAKILLIYLVLYRINSHRKKSLGLRLKQVCEKLGPSFIKFGQILSGRYDLLSEDDLMDLRGLLDDVDRMPDDAAKHIIQTELGDNAKRLSDLEFLANASIAQVYRAELDGEPIVVKILHPDISEKLNNDFAILHCIARIVEIISPKLRRLQIANAVCDMAAWTRIETDFDQELKNIEKFRAHLERTFSGNPIRSDLGIIHIPKIYPEISTSHVLVMEWLNGITANDWLRGKRPAEIRDYDATKSVMTMFIGSLQPIFRGQSFVFHADPNPANIVIMKSGDVGLIDFGLIGEYDEELIRKANRLYFAIYLQNAELATRALIDFCNIPRKYYNELLPTVGSYVENSAETGFAEWMKGAVRILMQHKLRGSVTLPMMAKFVLLVDTLAQQFFPGQSTSDLLGEELRIGVAIQIKHNLMRTRPLETSLSLAYALSEVLAQGPKLTGKLVANML